MCDRSLSRCRCGTTAPTDRLDGVGPSSTRARQQPWHRSLECAGGRRHRPISASARGRPRGPPPDDPDTRSCRRARTPRRSRPLVSLATIRDVTVRRSLKRRAVPGVRRPLESTLPAWCRWREQRKPMRAPVRKALPSFDLALRRRSEICDFMVVHIPTKRSCRRWRRARRPASRGRQPAGCSPLTSRSVSSRTPYEEHGLKSTFAPLVRFPKRRTCHRPTPLRRRRENRHDTGHQATPDGDGALRTCRR